MRFQPGDKVRHRTRGVEDVVRSVPGMSEYDKHGFIDARLGMRLVRHDWTYQEEWEVLPTAGAAPTAKKSPATKRVGKPAKSRKAARIVATSRAKPTVKAAKPRKAKAAPRRPRGVSRRRAGRPARAA